MATNTPPGLLRTHFGFMSWKDFNPDTYKEVLTEARKQIKKPSSTFHLNDSSRTALELAETSAEELGFTDYMTFSNEKFQHLEYNGEPGTLILNPPYGERLSRLDVIGLYKQIGDTLKSHYNGFDAWILSSNMDAFKNVGLRPSRKIPLMNGSLQCKFHKYEMYRGSKKAKYQKQGGEAE